MENSGLIAFDFFEQVDDTYGRNISGPVPVEEDYEGIELNQSSFVLQEDHLVFKHALLHKHPYHLYIKQYRHTLKHMVY